MNVLYFDRHAKPIGLGTATVAEEHRRSINSKRSSVLPACDCQAAATRLAGRRRNASWATWRPMGLVTSGGKERQTRWKLTDAARWIAAALSLNPSIADGHFAVCQLLTFAPAGKLVSELLPSGLENYSGGREVVDAFLWTQDLLLPALVAGWCESFSDMAGRVAYRVTPEGEAAANGPAPEPPEDLPAEDDELGDLYWKCYGEEIQRLQRIPTPDRNDLAPLPLSAGLWCNVIGPWTKSKTPTPPQPLES